MKTHPTKLSTTEAGYALGKELIGLRYDILSEVLSGMSDQAAADAAADSGRGRQKLSFFLGELAHNLKMATCDAVQIEKICHQYIQQEKQLDASASKPPAHMGCGASNCSLCGP